MRPIALLVVLFAAVAAAGVAPARAQAPPTGAVLQVLVLNREANSFFRMGTAFHLGNGLFYTSAHVVKSPLIPEGFKEWYLAGTTATRTSDSWLPVTIDCIHPSWHPGSDPSVAAPYDVARLKVTGTPALPAALVFSPRAASAGMRVSVVGFPAASRAWPPVLYSATGRIADLSAQQSMLIQLEAGFVLEGSSGSPVLADGSTVVGVLYGEVTGPNLPGPHHVAVTAQVLKTMCP
jgi:V8-like Glu-specific endopeptidase